MKRNKWIALALCAALTCSLAACGTKAPDEPADPAAGSVQIPNPWTDCETMEDAAGLAGFDFALPNPLPEGFVLSAIQALEGEAIQVLFQKDDVELCLRKAAGTEDPSGDYTQYEEETAVRAGGVEVAMRGADGRVSLAVWTDGGYASSIAVSGDGISADDMSALAAQAR